MKPLLQAPVGIGDVQTTRRIGWHRPPADRQTELFFHIAEPASSDRADGTRQAGLLHLRQPVNRCL